MSQVNDFVINAWEAGRIRDIANSCLLRMEGLFKDIELRAMQGHTMVHVNLGIHEIRQLLVLGYEIADDASEKKFKDIQDLLDRYSPEKDIIDSSKTHGMCVSIRW